jgi:hypothetical protein
MLYSLIWIGTTTRELLHVGRMRYNYGVPPDFLEAEPTATPSFDGDPDWSSYPRGEALAPIRTRPRDEMTDVFRPAKANRLRHNTYGVMAQDLPVTKPGSSSSAATSPARRGILPARDLPGRPRRLDGARTSQRAGAPLSPWGEGFICNKI